MTNEEIIKLGTTLGLHFNQNDNPEDLLAKNNVVFNGINYQRFRFEGSWNDDEILKKMGEALIEMGERKKSNVKMSNKKRNKEIRRKHELKLEIERNPDWCWCQELLGKLADVDYENDFAIGETEPIDGFPYWNSKNFTQPIYRCKRCGKKHEMMIVFA